MNIFSAGIVWDPREPLPPEYATVNNPAANLAVIGGQQLYTAPRFHSLPGAAQPAMEPRLFPSATVKETHRNVLPAVSVSITGRITGDIAEVTVRQLFWNDADIPIHKGSYTFPLPNGCTVTGFTCRIGNNKVLKAAALPKAEAQEEFQRALAANTTTALLDMNTPEIYTSSIGHIPPHTRIKTDITYAAILKRVFGDDANTTTLVIPTYIANRYGKYPGSLEGLNLESKPNDISLRIEIFETENIQHVQSASHEINVDWSTTASDKLNFDQVEREFNTSKQQTAIVTFAGATKWIETDFILSFDTIYSKGERHPEIWLEMHPSFDSQAAIMLTVPPRNFPFQNEVSKIGEIIFVADRSGSMEDKIESLRSAMHFFLKGIPVGRSFNIWSFGSNYECLWDKSRVYDEESLSIALDYVNEKFHEDMGGTELLPALEAAIAARDWGLPCDVIVLTDGEVWQLGETLNLVRKARNYSNGAIRFFSLGLGAHVSHALIEGIAREGGGCSEVIPKADQGGWEARMIAILKAALTIHVHDLRLDIVGLKAMTAPANLHSLSPFQAHRIFLLLEQGSTLQNGNIALTFISEGKRTTMNTSVTRLDKPGTLIHSLSARALLDDIERGISLSDATHIPKAHLEIDGRGEEFSSLAESIACKYTLPSRWTSLFLLSKTDETSAVETTPTSSKAVAMFHIESRSLQSQRGTARAPIRRTFPQVSPFPGMSVVNTGSIDMGRAFLDNDDEDQDEVETMSRSASHLPSSPFHYDSRPSVKVCPQKESISFILSHQAFDGSIGSEVLIGIYEPIRSSIVTLKSWLHARTTLDNTVLDRVATTDLIVRILERHYKDYEDLWARIREKAVEYIRLQLIPFYLDEEFLEYSRKMFDQLEGKVCLNLDTSSCIFSEEGLTDQHNANDGNNDSIGSYPILVREAPIED
ncbi:von Willebrand factor type A domain-containing protein [Xylaria bambusicola]|uniref:von Willebrand factor type A domain-containing protein n=1 Tax=Xylaria bambusicola TaxID=326684 RepID=UPI00200747D8|nr:von Willebrand factor type A domain-containing protein [Xylaria bambusicola]KAI0517876.1 von Willebrand factor type A domain-containing protein [Xylaria bambusicola]